MNGLKLKILWIEASHFISHWCLVLLKNWKIKVWFILWITVSCEDILLFSFNKSMCVGMDIPWSYINVVSKTCYLDWTCQSKFWQTARLNKRGTVSLNRQDVKKIRVWNISNFNLATILNAYLWVKIALSLLTETYQVSVR